MLFDTLSPCLSYRNPYPRVLVEYWYRTSTSTCEQLSYGPINEERKKSATCCATTQLRTVPKPHAHTVQRCQ